MCEYTSIIFLYSISISHYFITVIIELFIELVFPSNFFYQFIYILIASNSFIFLLLHPFGSLLLSEIPFNLILAINICFILIVVSPYPSSISVYQYFSLLTGFQNLALHTIPPAYAYSRGMYLFITISSCAIYTLESHSTI